VRIDKKAGRAPAFLFVGGTLVELELLTAAAKSTGIQTIR
jgi:hypothetical protein